MRVGSLAMQTVLITGHTGFVGRHLTDRLRSEGVTVRGTSKSCGFDILTDPLPLKGIDHVYHLAARTFVPKAWTDPESFYLINAHGTVRVLEQCRQAGTPMTYMSAYVYGQPSALPISENTSPKPNNPYAFSKFAGETACRFYSETFQLPVSIIRPFNIFGPGQDPSFLIPYIIQQILDSAVAEIYLDNLAPRRDYVYVDDVIDALIAAPRLPSGSPFNVGSGRSISVEDVIRSCLHSAGISKPYHQRGNIRANEINDVIANISAIDAAIGWRPQVNFEQGIRSILAKARS